MSWPQDVTFRRITFFRGPKHLHFVELSSVVAPRQLRFMGLSFAVAPSNYMFTKKVEVMVITSCSLLQIRQKRVTMQDIEIHNYK